MSTHPTPRTRRAATLALAAAALLGAGATPAAADSIAYVKGGDLWLTTPDGARQYRVTNSGGYSTVSQSDTGKLAALRGDRIVTLDPVTGQVLGDVLTPVSSGMPGTAFSGPFDPAINPAGTKISYTYYYQYTGYDPYCNPSNNCYVKRLYQGTGFTRPDRLTGWDEEGFKRQSGWVSASWTGDNEVMLHDPNVPLNEDVIMYMVGDEHAGMPAAMTRWFTDPDAKGLRDGEMTRDKTKIAYVAGERDAAIRFYRGLGGYPHTPEGCYALTPDAGTEAQVGEYSSPSWSPSGAEVAWADGRGIYAHPIPDMTTGCGTPAGGERQIVAGPASSPDWGPADVPAGAGPGAAPAPGGPGPAPGGPKPGEPKPGVPGGDGKGGVVVTGPGGLTLTAPKVRLATALRRGVIVKVSGAPAKKRLTATAKSGGRKVASGKVRTTASGSGKLKLVFTKAARRALAKKKTVKLVISGKGLPKLSLTLKR